MRLSDLSAGHDHACVMVRERDARCWGDNSRNQLSSVAGPVIGEGWSYDDWRGRGRLVVGDDHSCVFTIREVSCWGNNENGQLGNGTTEAMGGVVPVDLRPESPQRLSDGELAAMAAGRAHNCVVEFDDASDATEVWCWGDNAVGQLGREASGCCSSARRVEGLPRSPVRSIAAGGDHTCVVVGGALLNSPPDAPPAEPQELWCWGDNSEGQLGLGDDLSPRSEPNLVELPGIPLSVAAGQAHTCAILSILGTGGPEAYCWGRGQAEGGTPTPIPLSVPITITAGRAHSCAASVDGLVSCWGENEHGQLGTPPSGPSVEPVAVETDAVFLEIAAGANFTCGVTELRELLCWGSNANGELGRDGSDTYVPGPTTVLTF